MPNGASPPVADEVRRTLERDDARASEEAVDSIVRHATATVPFYRRRVGAPFDQLPVASKPMMVADPQDFFAVGSRPEKLTSRLSSGTSGIMFRSYFDDQRIAHHRAELVGMYRFLGADPFGSFLHCRTWYQVTSRQRSSYALRGQYLYAAEQDDRTVRDIARWLRRRRGSVIIGLCSYMEVLFERFDDLGLTFDSGTVSVVLGGGEPPTAHLAELARRQFGVELRMRYSNTENGLLGITPAGSTTYKLNTSAFHVEILDLDSDEPAPAGELGRIVVTDLHNRAMPFIRYDTGDLGRFTRDASGQLVPNTLAELAGRVRDFPIAGTAEAPRRATHFRILEPVERIRSITQFQLRQHAIGRFTWILSAARSPQLEAELRRVLDDEIGDITSCSFVYTDATLHSGAGKRQTFVNEIPDPEALLRPGRSEIGTATDA